jgi:hypothetical protein
MKKTRSKKSRDTVPLRSSSINSKEAIPRSLAGLYDNPIPTRFLAPIDCLKIPAQAT